MSTHSVSTLTSRLAKIALAALLLCGWQQYANASRGAESSGGTGWCTSDQGTKLFSFNFKYTSTNVNDNKAGVTISPAYTWDNSGTYAVTCQCSDTGDGTRWYKGDEAQGSFVITKSGLNYHSVDDYFAVASEVYIASLDKYYATPFTDINNHNVDSDACGKSDGGKTGAGSKGRVSLYFKRPFVGVHTLPTVQVTALYGSHTKGSYPSSAMAAVNMSAVVVVPQTCTINDGQVVNVEFDSFPNTTMKTKGAMPTGFTPNVQTLAYICKNVSQGVLLSFTFKGETSAGDSDALKTDNKDVGIRIEDMNGKLISPNEGELPAAINYSTQSGSTSFKSYPVNTTGEVPAAGEFSSSATIITNLE